MRPSEIDYSSHAKHYYDISNGEVLAGKTALKSYVQLGADPAKVEDLGQLLRYPVRKILEVAPEKLDSSDWTPEKCSEYGRWLVGIVAPPKQGSRKLTHDVVLNAWYLGIGPGETKLKELYGKRGTYSNFYKAIRANNVKLVKNFDEWEISDFVAYIKRVGREQRPFMHEFNKRNRANPNNPSYYYMSRRFEKIGGFQKLVELAGFTVVRLWNKDDYVNWGVKFMQANNGQPPTTPTLNYFSTLRRGPTADTVKSKFDSLGDYQRMVMLAYGQAEREKRDDRAAKLKNLEDDLKNGTVPIELFQAALPKESSSNLQGVNMAPVELIGKELGIEQLLGLYAKYKVSKDVAPGMLPETRIKIIVEDNSRSFEANIRKSNLHITPADIEHAALMLELFDYIWPTDDGLEHLKINESCRQYVERRRARDRAAQARRKATKALLKAA